MQRLQATLGAELLHGEGNPVNWVSEQVLEHINARAVIKERA